MSDKKSNYSEIVEQTYTEKVEMYMECEKDELARMLATRDALDGEVKKQSNTYNTITHNTPSRCNTCGHIDYEKLREEVLKYDFSDDEDNKPLSNGSYLKEWWLNIIT
jgi:hypothetical protein